MTAALDLQRLRRSTLTRVPFSWGVVRPTFTSFTVADRLTDHYPRSGFIRTNRSAGEKRYTMDDLTLVRHGVRLAEASELLSQEWRTLVDELCSDAYRRTVSGLTQVNLNGAQLEIRLCRYSAGCWLSPHTDRPDKRLTHILYFNRRWDADWGGMLRILRSPEPHDIDREVAPLLDSSVLLVRSEASWHSVAQVRDGVSQVRRSLLVHFVADPPQGGTERLATS